MGGGDRLSLLREQPAVGFVMGVCLRPAIVADAGKLGVPNFSWMTAVNEGADHLSAAPDGDGGVCIAVNGPYTDGVVAIGPAWIAAAADRNHGGETAVRRRVRIAAGQHAIFSRRIPTSEAAHG